MRRRSLVLKKVRRDDHFPETIFASGEVAAQRDRGKTQRDEITAPATELMLDFAAQQVSFIMVFSVNVVQLSDWPLSKSLRLAWMAPK